MIDAMHFADLIGKGFRYHGRGPLEYDCYGLLRECIHRTTGIWPTDFSSSESAEVNGVSFAELIGREWERIPVPVAGCGVTYRLLTPYTTHCGFMLTDEMMLHVIEKSNVVAERIYQPIWEKRITGLFHFKPTPGRG
jgi:cell wall-associated NlpC family hydrolase